MCNFFWPSVTASLRSKILSFTFVLTCCKSMILMMADQVDLKNMIQDVYSILLSGFYF
jgi:hypothetical protein